jgi:hypothetical protein
MTISGFRATTAVSSCIAWSILLLVVGRGSAVAQNESLEQALTHITDPEVVGAIRTIVKYAPKTGPAVAEAITKEANGVHYGGATVEFTAGWMIARAIEQGSLLNRDIPARREIISAMTTLMAKSGFAKHQAPNSTPYTKEQLDKLFEPFLTTPYIQRDGVVGDAIQKTVHESMGVEHVAPVASNAKTSGTGDPVKGPPDAMLQAAVSAIPDAIYKSQTQQLLYRISPDFQHALAQICTEQARPYHGDPIQVAQGLLTALTGELTLSPGTNVGSPFLETIERTIKNTAAFSPGAAEPLANALNVMTRYSSHYANVDWRPAIQQFSKERQSDYLDANLGKMLAESLRSNLSGTQAASPAAAR